RQAHELGKKKKTAFVPSSFNGAKELLKESAEREKRVAELANPLMVYAGTLDAKPEMTYLLYRGEATQKRDEVKPSGLSAVPVMFAIHTNENSIALTEDQQRRLALAQWLVNSTNPLTARVMVNRIWQYHFGEGLV